MSDHIFIEGLSIDCVIGLADWERMVAQTVVLDLELACDLRRPAQADAVGPGDLNTKALSKRLQEFVSSTDFALIETLAERVCELVLAEFPVTCVSLRLEKPGAIRGARTVGVCITRRPGDYPL